MASEESIRQYVEKNWERPVRSINSSRIHIATLAPNVVTGIPEVVKEDEARQAVILIDKLGLDLIGIIEPLYVRFKETIEHPLNAWEESCIYLLDRKSNEMGIEQVRGKGVYGLARGGIVTIKEALDGLYIEDPLDNSLFENEHGAIKVANMEIPVMGYCPAPAISRSIINTAREVIGLEYFINRDLQSVNLYQ